MVPNCWLSGEMCFTSGLTNRPQNPPSFVIDVILSPLSFTFPFYYIFSFSLLYSTLSRHLYTSLLSYFLSSIPLFSFSFFSDVTSILLHPSLSLSLLLSAPVVSITNLTNCSWYTITRHLKILQIHLQHTFYQNGMRSTDIYQMKNSVCRVRQCFVLKLLKCFRAQYIIIFNVSVILKVKLELCI